MPFELVQRLKDHFTYLLQAFSNTIFRTAIVSRDRQETAIRIIICNTVGCTLVVGSAMQHSRLLSGNLHLIQLLLSSRIQRQQLRDT